MPLLPYSVLPGQPPAQNPAGYPISMANKNLDTGPASLGLENRDQLGSRSRVPSWVLCSNSEEQHGPWSVLGMWEHLIASEVPHSQAPAPQV